MTPEKFVSEVQQVKFEHAFNPYSDHCDTHDLERAVECRRQLLLQMLSAACAVEIDSIWVGRDLGYRGGRRTGLALTDDVNFHEHLARWHLQMKRPTNGAPVGERTAALIWRILSRISTPVFLWNVFPLHPHAPNDPFSNRAHTAKERDVGIEILAELIELLRPRRLIAVGNDAKFALEKVAGGVPTFKVRHPSYGGQAEFIKQSSRLFELTEGSLL